MEVDLAFRGIDLLAAFQDCRVRYLLNLIENLPRNTLTQEAMSQDDELAELLLAGRDPQDVPSRPIRWAEFTPEVAALFDVVDRLGDVVAGQVAAGGRKPPRIPSLPRPVTALHRIDRVRDERQRARFNSMLFPNQDDAAGG